MQRILISWIYGRPVKGAEADEARATKAAESYLDAAGAHYVECESEYMRQWLKYGDESRMSGLALTWIEARQAANIALTEGWHNTKGGYCDILAW